MTPPLKRQLIIFSSLLKTAHSVSHMAINSISHDDLYCCMSQIARFYGNQYIYFAQKVSGVYGYSRRTPSSSGKARKTPDFSWQTFASFVKNTQQIFWWVTDALIVENSSDKLLFWPEMTTLICFLRFRIYRTAAKADQTECSHREREWLRQNSIRVISQLFRLVKPTNIHWLSWSYPAVSFVLRILHLELCNNFWIKSISHTPNLFYI